MLSITKEKDESTRFKWTQSGVYITLKKNDNIKVVNYINDGNVLSYSIELSPRRMVPNTFRGINVYKNNLRRECNFCFTGVKGSYNNTLTFDQFDDIHNTLQNYLDEV